MKMIKAIFVALFLFCAYSAPSYAYNADESDVEVEVEDIESCVTSICDHYWLYSITAVDDNVVIKDVIVNRGNCRILTGIRPNLRNVRVRFGDAETFKVETDSRYRICQPKEVVVVTGTGEWVFEW